MAGRLKPDDYTVAWIAVLPIEAQAAIGMLDRNHGRFNTSRGEDYIYTGGEVNGHNVVVATLPAGQNYGVGAAAALASQVKTRFTNIWFTLLTGVGAGLPNLSTQDPSRYRDIRLGDVLVCVPDKTSTGIIHYDLGKDTDEGFEAVGRLAETPAVVRSAIGSIRTQQNPYMEGAELAVHLKQLQQRCGNALFECPSQDEDVLSASLQDMDDFPTEIVREARHKLERTKVWYGNIGSGNSMMRNSRRRDELRDKFDLIGMEMEAAGIMNVLPAGVIRGVSDYGDEHKNKKWQAYAAATAAAYAKGILSTINPRVTLDRQVLESDTYELDDEILASLSFPRMMDRRLNVQQPYKDTCKWILELPKYQEWEANSRGLLWIKGKPGAGKSTIMSFLYKVVSDRFCADNAIRLEFFFSARGSDLQHNILGMLRSLLNQLFCQDTEAQRIVRAYYQEKSAAFGRRADSWEWQEEELRSLLQRTIIASARERPILIFVDALDEAGTSSACEIAEYLHEVNDEIINASLTAKICISCRHYPIVSGFSGSEIVVERHNHDDITTYIEHNLCKLYPGPINISGTHNWQQIQRDIIQRSDGVFQWVRLVIPKVQKSIRDGLSSDEVRSQIRKIPQALSEVYEHILLDVMGQDYLPQTILFFKWICCAQQPLSLDELAIALHTKEVSSHLNSSQPASRRKESVSTNISMSSPRVITLSGGLAEVMLKEEVTLKISLIVQVIHQSVNDYLMEKGLLLLTSSNTQSWGHPHSTSNMSNTTIDNNSLMQKCHAEIYWSCLIHLATVLPTTKLNFEESKISSLQAYDRQVLQKKQLKTSSLIEYAVRNIFIHAEKAQRFRQRDSLMEIEMIGWIAKPWSIIYRLFNEDDSKHPGTDFTILHIAAANNLYDLIDNILHKGESIHSQNIYGETALHLAARWGHLDSAKILVDAGLNIDAMSRRGDTPLSLAAAHGHMTMLRWFLGERIKAPNCVNEIRNPTEVERGALANASRSGHEEVVWTLLKSFINLKAENGDYDDALMEAVEAGNEYIIQMLLNYGVDANCETRKYQSALVQASYAGRLRIAKLLLDHGANASVVASRHRTALIAAASQGHLQVARTLLEYGADPNISAGGRYENALTAALVCEHDDLVVLLFDYGVMLDTSNDLYGADLVRAAGRGQWRTVSLLLDHGVDVNSTNHLGETALTVASGSGRTDVVRVLLKHRANIYAQSKQGVSALTSASQHGRTDVVRILLENELNINASQEAIASALVLASERGHTDIIQTLIDHGADLNAYGTSKYPALIAAARYHREDVVHILLNNGASTEMPDGSNGTALIAATIWHDIKIVRILLEHGANIDAQNMYGTTALMVAVRSYQKDIVRTLLDAGANVALQDFAGDTALMKASEMGQKDIVQMINDRGRIYGVPR